MIHFRLPFQKNECTGTCTGASAGLASYVLWGVAVLFWPLLSGMSPLTIMSHRMIWTCVFLGTILLVTRQMHTLGPVLKNRRILGALFSAAALLGANWSLYIWAVNTGQVVETALGYFINPLINVLLGRVLLREQLSRPQLVAILLAFAGVGASIAAYGQFPWMGFTLAFTFSIYGYIQKTVRLPAAPSLFLQSLMLTPIALTWLIIMEEGLAMFGYGWERPVLLLCTIFFTGLPLMLFGYAARHITLASVGILQYVSPSLSLILAITVLGEQLKPADMISFPVIWLALAIYTWDAVHHLKRMKER